MANINSGSGAVKDSQSGSAVKSAFSGTGGVGRTHSMTGGAAKVFREFKWGLLTLFLLMAVVVGLVYDGGRKKTAKAEAEKASNDRSVANSEINLDSTNETGVPPVTITPAPADHSVVENPGLPVPAPTPGFDSRPNPGRADVHGGGGGVRVEPGTRVIPTPPTSPLSERPATASKTYTVKAGDNLTKIANTVLPGKGNIKALLAANKDVLVDANHLKVGMILKVPTALPAAVVPPSKKPTEMAVDHEKPKSELRLVPLKDVGTKDIAIKDEYVVQSGDSLERIARKLYNDVRRWRDIYEWNRDQIPEPARLKVGQTLRLKVSTLTPNATPATGSRAEAEIHELPDPRSSRTHVSESESESESASVSDEPKVEVMSESVHLNDLP